MNRKVKLLAINFCLTMSLCLAQFNTTASNTKIKDATSLANKIKIIENWYDEANDTERPGGYAVVIIKDGKVLLKKTYGYANQEHKVPFKFNTAFNFASVAKQFTGFAIAKLIQDGKLTLDDDIRKYLPKLPDFGHKITIQHLLDHSSGLRDWVPLTKLSGRLENDVITGEQIMGLIENQKTLNFIPGEKHAYCNTGYFLLANIAAQITQKSFDEWTKENIFNPIGMESSLFPEEYDKIIPNRAESYVRKGGTYKRMSVNSSAIGSSDLWSTMDDMIKWLINLDTKEVGGKKLFEMMTTSSSLNNGDIINYNFGLDHGDHHGRELISHGGSWGGYACELKYFPKENLSFLFMANRNPSGVYLSGRALDLIFNIVHEESEGEYINGERPYLEMDLKTYDKYLGWYALKLKEPTGNQIYHFSQVFIKDERLVAHSSMYRNNLLFPISDKKFFIKGDSNEYEFFTNKDGNCYQYTITHGENEYTFLKMEYIKVNDIDKAQELLGEYYSDELKTSYILTIKDGVLTFTHPVNEDAPIFKVGDGTNGYAGEYWWNDDVVFIRDKSNKVIGFYIQTTNGNLSTNIRFDKITSKNRL